MFFLNILAPPVIFLPQIALLMSPFLLSILSLLPFPFPITFVIFLVFDCVSMFVRALVPVRTLVRAFVLALILLVRALVLALVLLVFTRSGDSRL